MQISAALSALPGVERALVAMATGVNLDLLSGLGFEPPPAAGPDDLLVALVTADDAVSTVLERLDAELADAGGAPAGAGPPGAVEPRTTGAAVVRTAATVAVVSTPGRYAFVEAMDALDAGASVMVFSDNVPIAEEVALKRVAAGRGLLVMGPDCGTAVIGGVGIGFANVVRPGPVGLVAASGTGAQQVMSLLAAAGVGISHCLGVGGRDLSAEVAGRSTHAALDLLDADPATRVIVLVAKPPAAPVHAAVRDHVERLSTPVVFAPLGPGSSDLTSTVESVLSELDVAVPVWPSWSPPVPARGRGGFLRGLYAGGTLCVEAISVAAPRLGPIGSNVVIDPLWTAGLGHTMFDLGADEFTAGRPHPMIDPGPRLDRFTAEAADPLVAVILLDVVLGHAAHPDPAPAIAAAIAAARPGLPVVVSLIGTPDDPQGLDRQATILRTAGAEVFASNAQAARRAAEHALGSPQ